MWNRFCCLDYKVHFAVRFMRIGKLYVGLSDNYNGITLSISQDDIKNFWFKYTVK